MADLVEQFDVVVVGGGPGGSTAATLIAKRNHRVALIERQRFPRYQIGESLLPSTVHGICRLLGVQEALDAAGFMRKDGGTWRWGRNAAPWSFSFRDSTALVEAGGAYAFQVERMKFDQILLDNAKNHGVDVREGTSVTGVVKDGARIVGVRWADGAGRTGVIRARFVIDASGHQSSLHLEIGERAHSRFFQNIALFGYFEGGKRQAPPREGNIICAAFDKGWFWYIPLSDRLTSVGAVIAREHADELRRDPADAMRSFIASCPLIADYLADATRCTTAPYDQIRIRKDYSYTTSRFWGQGLVLVGDAACFVDPVLSTGVHLATYSGLLAARTVNTCFAGEIDEDTCFAEFEHRYRTEFKNIYEYLISFYDMNKDESSYFWDARQILHTEEAANLAFIRLVSGGATTGKDYFTARRGAGERWEFEVAVRTRDITAAQASFERLLAATNEGVDVAALRPPRPSDRDIGPLINPRHHVETSPVREGGLTISADPLLWARPEAGAQVQPMPSSSGSSSGFGL